MLSQSVQGALKNRWLVLFFSALIAGIGIYSYTKMEIDAYPDISGVGVTLTTTYPGRAAEEVEQQVTVPLERAMASVPHAEVVRSRTIFGLSQIQIEFEPDVDDYWARQVVFQKIGEAGLSVDATVQMEPLATAYGEIYAYELEGDKDHGPMDLRTLNDWVVTPRLLKADGVVDVENFGGLGKQYALHLVPKKLLQYGTTLQEVTGAVKANNSSGGGSLLERGSTSLVVRGLGQVTDYHQLEDVFIKNSSGTPVFVHDVGTVAIDHLPQTGIFGKDDQDNGVEGIVIMRRGENPSETLEGIEEAVTDINANLLPKGVKIVPFYNRTELIDETVHTVFRNTLEGILLVVLTLFIFLGNPRVAFIVALTIPGALLFALILMKLTGIPISLLSIGSLDFGIIVDGAIIVSENVIRHLSEERNNDKIDETILEASNQVQRPMIFSMLIVIIAYLPLLSLRYIEGLLFRPMAITLCFALFGALLIALYLVPVLSSFLFKGGRGVHEKDVFKSLTDRYARVLPKVIRARKWVI
jgi:cobalt-zinc-cadmium resistance protein CzcA